ncbi:holocytochrome c synthase [Chytridiales sp. JEL 0842]|nr:holocytochrome c synthase [Chytridiales sp. JEL 0842]
MAATNSSSNTSSSGAETFDKARKGECPVDHSSFAAIAGARKTASSNNDAKKSDHEGGSCPVPHHGSGDLNPLNMIPKLSEEMAPGQKIPLSKEREKSTIPKSNVADPAEETWEYPSPQGFYNALKRKGWETPEEEVPMMVSIHNFLNEACWQELLKWEKKYHCAAKPFDRHDWTIDRCGTRVRYVIDYYSGHDEGDAPAFNVDVRPALDSPSAIYDRLRQGAKNVWEKWFGTGDGEF